MKIVTMCQGGNVRSVAAKFLLHYKFGHDAIACGWESNSSETRELLFDWADKIVIMQVTFKKYVPDRFHSKLIAYDVGEDRFGYAFHPQLLQMIEGMIVKHGLFCPPTSPSESQNHQTPNLP